MSISVQHAAQAMHKPIEHSTVNLLKALGVMAAMIMLAGGWFFAAQSSADEDRDTRIAKNATDIRAAESAQLAERSAEVIQDARNQKDILELKKGQAWSNNALIRIGTALDVDLPPPPPPE